MKKMVGWIGFLYFFVLLLTCSAQDQPGRIVYGYRAGKKVHLTFDDGPHPVYTPRLLEYLKALNIKATFFVLGKNAKQYPDLVRRIIKEGHQVASHSYDHPELSKLSKEKLKFQIEETEKILAEITGIQPYMIRPPYGAMNAGVKEYLKEKKYTIMMWNVDTLDWKWKNVDKIVEYTLLNTPASGGIILLHDIHETSVDSVPRMVEGLMAKGFQFVSQEEILKSSPAPATTSSGSTTTPTTPATPTTTPAMPTESQIKPLQGEGKISASELNFRDGPASGFKSLGTLKKDAVVRYLGEYDGWYKIRVDTPNGPKVGWVSSKYVQTTVRGATEALRDTNR